MEQKIIFLKFIQIKSKEGKNYFKLKFLTEDLEFHEQFIDTDLMQYIVNKKIEPLSVHKANFIIDNDMKLHIKTMV